jgi:hypothetical protein
MYQCWYISDMNTPILDVRFFASDGGNEPVREWLKSLQGSERRTIGEDIKTVQFGWPLGMPLVRKLAKDLWEVRVHLVDRIAGSCSPWSATRWCCCTVSSRNHKPHHPKNSTSPSGVCNN